MVWNRYGWFLLVLDSGARHFVEADRYGERDGALNFFKGDQREDYWAARHVAQVLEYDPSRQRYAR